MKTELIYDINKPWLTLDEWQKKYIETEGNCFLLCGRQSGKTTAMSIKIARCAIKEKQACDYLVVAFTEKQAYNLFFKTLMYLQTMYPKMIKKGKDKPTMHEINLMNGVTIMCYACGNSGEGIRTFTIKKLFIDEAAPMNREVFISISPMLSVTNGTMDISSTPRGKEGYFYDCSKREDFEKFYVSAEDCPRHSKSFLEAEKSRMSKLEYAQEYLAQFLDELKRVFDNELIKKVCVLKRRINILSGRNYYLGADIAGMGLDKTVISIVDKINSGKIEQVESIIRTKQLTTETTKDIISLDNSYDNKKLYIDDGGVGYGVFSELLSNDSTKRKVVAINNAARPLNRDDTKHKKILKEDLYMNLLALMEQDKIKLLDDDEIILSLKSIQHEYLIKENKKSQLRIFGNDSHSTESLIRAAWCNKDKNLNIWIR